jgi:peroxiredoxin
VVPTKIIPYLAILLLLPLFGCDTPRPEAVERSVGVSSNVAPDLKLKLLDGETVHLSDYRGKVVLLNFWATWCPPCRVEIPEFVDLHKNYKDKDVVVIGVSFDHESDSEYVRSFSRQAGITYQVAKVQNYSEIVAIERAWSGIEGISTLRGYGRGDPENGNGSIQMIPTTFIIDKTGMIVRKHVGPREAEQLASELDLLL